MEKICACVGCWSSWRVEGLQEMGMVAAVDALFTQCYRCCYLMEYTLYVCLQFLGGSDALRLFDCLASVYQIEIKYARWISQTWICDCVMYVRNWLEPEWDRKRERETGNAVLHSWYVCDVTVVLLTDHAMCTSTRIHHYFNHNRRVPAEWNPIRSRIGIIHSSRLQLRIENAWKRQRVGTRKRERERKR